MADTSITKLSRLPYVPTNGTMGFDNEGKKKKDLLRSTGLFIVSDAHVSGASRQGSQDGTYKVKASDLAKAIGVDTTGDAEGEHSFASGEDTLAKGNRSSVSGKGTKALSDDQVAAGRYNRTDSAGKFAEIMGNGTENVPSNARTLDWNGNERLAGNLYVMANENGEGGKPLFMSSGIEVSVQGDTKVELVSSEYRTYVLGPGVKVNFHASSLDEQYMFLVQTGTTKPELYYTTGVAGDTCFFIGEAPEYEPSRTYQVSVSFGVAAVAPLEAGTQPPEELR